MVENKETMEREVRENVGSLNVEEEKIIIIEEEIVNNKEEIELEDNNKDTINNISNNKDNISVCNNKDTIKDNTDIKDTMNNTDIKDTMNNIKAIRENLPKIKLKFYPGVLYLNIRTIINYHSLKNISDLTFIHKKSYTFNIRDLFIGENIIDIEVNEEDYERKIDLKVYCKYLNSDKLFYCGFMELLPINFTYERILNNLEKRELKLNWPNYLIFFSLFDKFCQRRKLKDILMPSYVVYIPESDLKAAQIVLKSKNDLFEFLAVRKSLVKILYRNWMNVKIKNFRDQKNLWKRAFVNIIGFKIEINLNFKEKLVYFLHKVEVKQKKNILFFRNNQIDVEIEGRDEEEMNVLKKKILSLQNLLEEE